MSGYAVACGSKAEDEARPAGARSHSQTFTTDEVTTIGTYVTTETYTVSIPSQAETPTAQEGAVPTAEEAAVHRYADRRGGFKVEHVVCYPTRRTFTCFAIGHNECAGYEARHQLSGDIVVRELDTVDGETLGCVAKNFQAIGR